MAPYKYQGPVNCNVDFDTSPVKGKTAIVTGGVQGIGLEYTRALSGAGAFVVIGDVDVGLGQKVQSEVANTKFVKCDVTRWEDQVELFKTAIGFSPQKAIDIVIANAGILGTDDIVAFDADKEHPTKPELKVTQIDLIGVMYTSKLALHHFRRQYEHDSSRETALVLQGSIAGYVDVAGSPQYNASKFALRGLLHSFRQTTHLHGTRVQYIAPWFVKTKILSDKDIKLIGESGTEFAEATDAADAVLRFLSDPSINGRAFAIVPRSWQPRGYVDIDDDDYTPSKHWLGVAIQQAEVPSQKEAAQ